tara:strand:+ start:207 stop:728 length:522 start_codon:yes stop_codon:yes gene_type:complete
MEPGARTVTPLTINAIDSGQTGIIVAEYPAMTGNLTGHAGGSSGSGSQGYLELLCGEECGAYTGTDNTTGTKFYPDVNFFYSILNVSRHITSAIFYSMGIQCKSGSGIQGLPPSEGPDDLARGGYYNPTAVSPSSDYLFLQEQDIIFGRFTRIAISINPAAGAAMRAIITKGV